MSLICRWKMLVCVGLSLAAVGLSGCGDGREGTSTPVTATTEAALTNSRIGMPGVAASGTEAHWSEIITHDQARPDMFAPEPVVMNAPSPSVAPNRAPSVLARPGETAQLLVGSPPPAATFQAAGTSGTPPDTMGAVGPNHVVTIMNFRVVIQNRTGTTLGSVDLNAFFGSVIPAGNSAFDPRAAYDHFANRWILTCPSGIGFSGGNSVNLLAVSQTSDPTGAWRFYAFPADPAGLRWADHNGLGFNSKWVVIHANMIPFGSADARQHFWAFNKAALYAPSPSAQFTLLVGDGWQSTPAVTYDAAEPDLYLVETQGSGLMRLRRVTGAVGAEVLQDVGSITTPAWGFGLFVPQQGSSASIDFSRDWIQNVVVRNGSVWATHHVGLPASGPTHNAIRWLEIDPSPLTVLQLGTLEDATGLKHYGYPSIAVNANGDALIGYSRSSTAQFVSANYAARAVTDPPGTLRDDLVYKAGEAPYDSGRWGDYSNTVVDPVDNSTMWTIQEAAAAPGNSSYALWWAKVPAPGAATGCTAATAVDLGPPDSAKTVPNDGCVKVQDAYPFWWGTRNMRLQSMSPGVYPVPFTWSNSCAGTQGSAQFTGNWQSRIFGPTNAACATVIDLQGSGAGTITLRYFAE
jgi:hypothetical protein